MTISSPSMDTTVIVLNYNGRHWLSACLAALQAQARSSVELLVVDNASTDGSPALVQRDFPGVRLVVLERNLGFTGGNNAGARQAAGRHLAFLNNDTVVDGGWLTALRGPLDADPTVALTTSRVVYMDRPDILDSAGDGYLRAGGAFKRFHGQPADRAATSGEVFGACGAAFMIRREVFEDLGGFDEDFFAVYEDVDLSYRARLRGHRCVYVAEAVVRHEGSASLGIVSDSAVFHGQRNLEWTYLKNTPWPLLLRSLPSHVLYDVAGAIGYALRGQLRPFLAGKSAAIVGLPGVWLKRRQVQRGRRASAGDLWRVMDRGWMGAKRLEKRFDFGRSRP